MGTNPMQNLRRAVREVQKSVLHPIGSTTFCILSKPDWYHLYDILVYTYANKPDVEGE